MKNMKNAVLLLSMLMLGAIACFASEKPTNQTKKPKKIELTEDWIESHYDAFLIGDVLEVTLEEPGYDFVEVCLENIKTGEIYVLKKGDLRRELNIATLPKGKYNLKIFEELIFESITVIKL